MSKASQAQVLQIWSFDPESVIAHIKQRSVPEDRCVVYVRFARNGDAQVNRVEIVKLGETPKILHTFDITPDITLTAIAQSDMAGYLSGSVLYGWIYQQCLVEASGAPEAASAFNEVFPEFVAMVREDASLSGHDALLRMQLAVKILTYYPNKDLVDRGGDVYASLDLPLRRAVNVEFTARGIAVSFTEDGVPVSRWDMQRVPPLFRAVLENRIADDYADGIVSQFLNLHFVHGLGEYAKKFEEFWPEYVVYERLENERVQAILKIREKPAQEQ